MQYKVFIYIKFKKTLMLGGNSKEEAASIAALLPAPDGGEIEVVDVEEYYEDRLGG